MPITISRITVKTLFYKINDIHMKSNHIKIYFLFNDKSLIMQITKYKHNVSKNTFLMSIIEICYSGVSQKAILYATTFFVRQINRNLYFNIIQPVFIIHIYQQFRTCINNCAFIRVLASLRHNGDQFTHLGHSIIRSSTKHTTQF